MPKSPEDPILFSKPGSQEQRVFDEAAEARIQNAFLFALQQAKWGGPEGMESEGYNIHHQFAHGAQLSEMSPEEVDELNRRVREEIAKEQANEIEKAQKSTKH